MEAEAQTEAITVAETAVAEAAMAVAVANIIVEMTMEHCCTPFCS